MKRLLPLCALLAWLVVGVSALTLPATDNFNRADADIGANWTELGNASSNPGFLVSSNAVKANPTPGGGAAAFAMWNADSFTADQYSQFTFTTSGNMALAVRLADNGSGKANGYIWRVLGGTISKASNGSVTTLVSSISAPAVGSVCKMVIAGTTITVYDDGVSIGSTSDATYASGSPGLYGTSGNAGTADDWTGDNGGGGGGGGGGASGCKNGVLLGGIGCDARRLVAVR